MSKLDAINSEYEKTQVELRQLEKRQKVLLSKQTDMERKARTRRLIERGAILESAIPSVIHLSNDEVMALLSDISRLPVVLELTSKTPETIGAE